MTAILASDILKRIFLNENSPLLIKISPNNVPYYPIDKNPALVQTKAWHRIGDKLLYEPMIASFGDVYMRLPASTG